MWIAFEILKAFGKIGGRRKRKWEKEIRRKRIGAVAIIVIVEIVERKWKNEPELIKEATLIYC